MNTDFDESQQCRADAEDRGLKVFHFKVAFTAER